MTTILTAPAPFPVGTPFFRGFCDSEETIPKPPMRFNGQPIPLTNELAEAPEAAAYFRGRIIDAVTPSDESVDYAA